MMNNSRFQLDPVRSTVFSLIKYAVVLNGLVAASGIFWSPRPAAFALGIFFGAAIGTLNFYELAITLSKSVKMSPAKATQYASLKYFMRFLITAVVIVIALRSPYLDIIGTAFGLVSIKFVVFAMNLLNKKKASVDL